MGFKRVPQKYSASINEVTIGVGEKAIKLGGENVKPLYSFDAEIANAPKVGAEITDEGGGQARGRCTARRPRRPRTHR